MPLVLRTCKNDMSSYNGFAWPTQGPVTCNDWNHKPKCGNGLHGLLWGCGDGSLLNWQPDAKWLVVDVNEFIEIDNQKVKFPSGNVVFCGSRLEATNYLLANGAIGKPVVGASVIAGNHDTAIAGVYGTAIAADYGTATSGNYGNATAGHRGIAVAGYYGVATSGYGGNAKTGHYGIAKTSNHGTAIAGNHGTAKTGDYGTATADNDGTAIAGNHGIAIASNDGTATAGDHGTAIAGDHGIAIAGDHGTATAGNDGNATSGDHGTIIIAYYDGSKKRLAVGYVGEGEIKANVPYVVSKGKLIPKSNAHSE